MNKKPKHPIRPIAKVISEINSPANKKRMDIKRKIEDKRIEVGMNADDFAAVWGGL